LTMDKLSRFTTFDDLREAARRAMMDSLGLTERPTDEDLQQWSMAKLDRIYAEQEAAFAKSAGSTYVQIGREELEDWLDTMPLSEMWYRYGTSAGVYMLPLSQSVAIKLSSTIGGADDAKAVGQASMQLALVSRVIEHPRFGPMVLNKKAQGQSHFARTTNWKTNWREGVERMKDAYLKAQGFYDSLALIEDRDKYKADTLALIEQVPGWQSDRMLTDFHSRVETGGILTVAQMEAMLRAGKKPVAPSAPVMTPTPAVPASLNRETEELLKKMRDLFVKAKAKDDKWLVEFLTSVGQALKGGRSLTDKQKAALDKNFARYGM
jgi:hypothetical protein